MDIGLELLKAAYEDRLHIIRYIIDKYEYDE
jgi:hypothetical protein